jgi:hypothetical protein
MVSSLNTGVRPATGERASFTAQNQTAKNWAAQWSGVLRNNWSMEAAWADYSSRIDVTSFEPSGLLGNAPIFNLAENKYYNGATFDGFVERPRQQFNLASNWFLMLGGRAHNIKVGYDLQNLESGAQFDFPNRQLYLADDYIQGVGPVFGANSTRRDYDSGPSISTGKIHALYARDKFELGDRVSLEAGVRFERQTGASDIGASTVDASMIAPRLSGTYDLAGDGKSLVTASYGRYYAGIIQSFSDAFAQVAQQTNYDNYRWDGTQFVFSNRVQLSGSSFTPNLDLKPYHMDEGTIGLQRQFGRTIGVGVRYIARSWDNLIDDVRTFNADNTINRQVVNYDEARRSYKGCSSQPRSASRTTGMPVPATLTPSHAAITSARHSARWATTSMPSAARRWTSRSATTAFCRVRRSTTAPTSTATRRTIARTTSR